MIAIVNVSKEFDRDGLQQYEVRINHEVITTFEHTRKHGLADCLRKAAAAVDNDIYETLKEFVK